VRPQDTETALLASVKVKEMELLRSGVVVVWFVLKVVNWEMDQGTRVVEVQYSRLETGWEGRVRVRAVVVKVRRERGICMVGVGVWYGGESEDAMWLERVT